MLILTAAGCTSRSITITSDPPGAEVSINRSVVGVTPIRVGFTHYGAYRLEIRKERYDTLIREEDISPRVWGYDPFALVADNAIPARLNDDTYLHYVLQPQKGAGDRADLLQRAETARDGLVTHPKSGQQIQIANYVSPSKGKPYTAPTGAPVSGAEGASASAEAAPVKTTPELQEVKPISAQPPEGLKLAKELGLDTKPEEKKPGTAEEKKEPQTPKAPRTPQGEELIYDKPEAKPEETPKKDK